jgi:hypothetical protein
MKSAYNIPNSAYDFGERTGKAVNQFFGQKVVRVGIWAVVGLLAILSLIYGIWHGVSNRGGK